MIAAVEVLLLLRGYIRSSDQKDRKKSRTYAIHERRGPLIRANFGKK